MVGERWDEATHVARILADTRPPRDKFDAEAYAAKIAAESILSEPARAADLSDEGIVTSCMFCGFPVRFSEAPLVREAFVRVYGQQAFELIAS